MIVRFDKLNRFETPSITLCNPGSVCKNGCLTNVVGMLSGTEAEEGVYNFNSTSEFNFRINRITYDDKDDTAYSLSMYKAIQNKRLLFVENVGYFVIKGVEDTIDNGIQYKDVRAVSVEEELANKKIPFIKDGTYKFVSTGGKDDEVGILNLIVGSNPLWTVGHVDDSLMLKYRTFEDVDVNLNCLAFLLQNVQDAFECIVLFDTINRTVNVYDQETYVNHTDIHITNRDLINSINITENGDDIYTALSVVGGENITISAINPLGTNVVYDFSHYKGWMSNDLRDRLTSWEDEVAKAITPYYHTSLKYYTKLSEASNIQMEMDRLDTQITMYSRCKENLVAEADTTLVGGYNEVIISVGGKPIPTYEEIADTIDEIDRLILECADKKVAADNALAECNIVIESLSKEIEKVHNRLSMDTYFGDNYYELMQYVFEGSYTDEYVTITDIMSHSDRFEQMKLLYDRAILQLSKHSIPDQEFSVDVESFIFEKEFSYWTGQLETGCLIQVEIEEGDIASLFMTSIVVNYDDHNMSMTYGNRFNKYDVKSLFENTLGSVSRSANSITYLKDIVTPIKNGDVDAMKNEIQQSKDITMASALSSKSEEIIIDGCGFTGRKQIGDGKYDPRQIKITSRNLAFTDDAWKTCRTAIGEILMGNGESAYGINAEVVVGDFIVGNNLRIVNSNGDDIFTVVEGRIEASIGDVSGRVSNLEQNADRVDIRVQALENSDVEIDSITTSTGYTFDENGLSICKDGEEIQNILDNTGMHVSRESNEILSANSDGVETINLVAREYVVVGSNSRFEDYVDQSGRRMTGCFYIGG